MTSTTADSFLLFLHIPKNAGTTLRSIIDCQYGRTAVLTYYNQPNRQLLDNLPYLLMDGRNSYRALVGHFSFGVHEKLGKPATYVTLMRDPIQRAISGYYENLKTDPARLTGANGSIRNLADDVKQRPEAYANQQIKMLAGLANETIVEAEHLDWARNNLATHFATAGTIERFDESLLLLSKRLGWRPCLYGRLNPGRADREIDRDALDALAELNALECTLYDEVSRKLDERIAAEGDAFSAAYAELTATLIAHPTNEAKLEAALLPQVHAFLRDGSPGASIR